MEAGAVAEHGRGPTALNEAQAVLERADCLYSKADVEAALDRMAAAIRERLGQANPLVLCAMVGGIVPTGLLLPRLQIPLQVDYIHATRYRGATAGGALQWIHRPTIPLTGRTVLIVDDVLDEGLTMAAVVRACAELGAAEVLTAVLIDKQLQRPAEGLQRADFVGLQAANLYLFGYGMDYKLYLRNADGIYAVKAQ